MSRRSSRPSTSGASPSPCVATAATVAPGLRLLQGYARATDQRPPRARGPLHHWDVYQTAVADLHTRGQLVPSIRGEGDEVRNPSVMVMWSALERWHRMAASFGLTPADRARLDVGKVDAATNPFEEIGGRTGRGAGAAGEGLTGGGRNSMRKGLRLPRVRHIRVRKVSPGGLLALQV